MSPAVQNTRTAQGESRRASDWRDTEECLRLARIALGISDRAESVFLTREALDLTARVLGDFDYEVG